MAVQKDQQDLIKQEYTYDPVSKRLATIKSGGDLFVYSYRPGTDLVERIEWRAANGNDLRMTRVYGYEVGTGRLESVTSTDRLGNMLYSVGYLLNNMDQRYRADVVRAVPGGSGLETSFYWLYDYDSVNADQLKSAGAYVGTHPARVNVKVMATRDCCTSPMTAGESPLPRSRWW